MHLHTNSQNSLEGMILQSMEIQLSSMFAFSSSLTAAVSSKFNDGMVSRFLFSTFTLFQKAFLSALVRLLKNLLLLQRKLPPPCFA